MARVIDNLRWIRCVDRRILARSHRGADGKLSIAGKLRGETGNKANRQKGRL